MRHDQTTEEQVKTFLCHIDLKSSNIEAFHRPPAKNIHFSLYRQKTQSWQAKHRYSQEGETAQEIFRPLGLSTVRLVINQMAQQKIQQTETSSF